jgi:two-component system response regulator YesN
MERVQQETFNLGSKAEELLFNIKFSSAEIRDKFISTLVSHVYRVTEWERKASLFSLFSLVYNIVEQHELQNVVKVRGLLLEFMETPKETSEDMTVWMQAICRCMSEYISSKRETAAQNLVDKAKRFIAEHYSDFDMSVEKIADYLHVSQSYFSALFRQETSKSYIQYLTDLRMTRAIELLKQTDEKTYEIARSVGYEEPNYFSYVFKKHFGVSPTKYRK